MEQQRQRTAEKPWHGRTARSGDLPKAAALRWRSTAGLVTDETTSELVEQAVDETLAYHAFPEEHWRRIRTNNPLERLMREIRRRTRVVGAFPDGQSCLNLAAARLRHIAGTSWSAKRYLNMDILVQKTSEPLTA